MTPIILLGEAPPGGAFPFDAASNAKGVDELFWLATILGAIAFAAVVAILAWSVVAFRARPGRKAAYDHGESPRARIVTAVFAIGVFVGLDVVLAVKDHGVYEEMYGDRPALAGAVAGGRALEVQCLAKQFEWLFRYPGKDGRFGTEDDLRSPVLVVPDDRVTVVRLRSIDVIHSFFLPNWRTKQDAVPGMTTTTAIHPGPGARGEWDIACAELCGMGHYKMKGRLLVKSPAEFAAWAAGLEKEIEEYGASTEAEEFWEQYDRRGPKEAAK